MMSNRIACIFLASILGLLGCSSAESADKFPLRALPDGTEYCVHEMSINSESSANRAEDTITRIKALSRYIKSMDGELIYYDWKDEKSLEALFEKACDQIDAGLEDYKSNFLADAQVSVADFNAYDSSPRVMFESDQKKLKGIGEGFNLQTKYTLDQCVVRIDLKDQTRDHSDKVEEIFATKLAITNGRVNFGLPILFANTMNFFSAYVLFWEHCDIKTELMEKILLGLEQNDPGLDFSNALVYEERNLDDIKSAFYIE